MVRQSDKLSINRRVKPKSAGENGDGSPTVGSFSTRNSVRLESATASISFSEINSITLCPRFCSTSATAIPGKRCPPVPPHAITAFITLQPSSNPWRHSRLHRGAFHSRRLQNPLAINVQQNTDAEHTPGQV